MTAHQLSSLESRLKSLSLPEDIAKNLGLSRGKNDSINIAYFGIKGDPVYISQNSRKTTTDLDDKRIYSRIRFSDLQVKINDSKHESPYLVDQIAAAATGITEAKAIKGNKYASPYGTDPIWYLNALQLDYTGDTLILVEGEFKAIAITYHLGIPAVSFPGITVNNIDQAIEDLLVEGCPKTGQPWKNIICLYDKDALDISDSKKHETKGLPCTERAISFCNSAFRFAGQFYAIKQQHRLNTALHFAQISPTSEQKGIDDHISAHGTKNALEAFKTLKTNEGIIVIPLYKSSYIKALKAHFSLTDQAAFYNAHKAIIGAGRFVFLGVVFEFTGTYFKVINDPHSFTGIAGTKIGINKYLSEKQQDIFEAIDKHYLSSLAAPTGSGKTTILKDLPGKKILCFPYRILAQQQAEKTGHRAFVGGVHPTDVPGIVSQDLIYCTYDKVQELSEVLPGSILIIDEAHTLTKHYNFRKDTVRHLVEIIEKRKALKVILLSGTPDDLLCAMYNAHQIQVSRAVNRRIKLHPIIAANSGDTAMLKAALTVIRKMDKNKVNFVFQNDRAKLELLKKHLVNAEGWNSDDIVIITKDHVQNEDKTYLEIIEKEKITGTKLILTTQLIAEGININNTNIGDIVIIDLFCPKTFVQFVNRYRQSSIVNVYDIKAPERILQADFFQGAKDRANAKYIRANADAQEVAAQHKKELENLTVEDQDFLCTINKNRGSKQSKVRPYLYTCEGQIIVDRLQIVHEVDREIINESNNAYFYTQISNYQGIEICNALSDSIDDKDKEKIKLTGQELEKEKAQQQQALIKDLKTRPEIVISAYFNHCDKSSNRKGIEFINKHCPDLYKPSNEAYSYHANNSHIFTSPVLTELIQYFVRLHWIKLPKQDLFDCLDTYNRYAARTTWTAFVHQYTAQEVHPKRHYRKFMDQVQRNDIADLEKIKDKLGQGSVSMNLAKQVIKQVTGSYPTDKKAFDLLKIIYEVSAHQKPAELERYDRYRDKDGKWIKVRDIENVPGSVKLKIGYTVKREKILYLKPYNRIHPAAAIWNDIKTFAAAILH